MSDEKLTFEEWLREEYGLDIQHERGLGTIPDHVLRTWNGRYQEYLDKNSPSRQ